MSILPACKQDFHEYLQLPLNKIKHSRYVSEPVQLCIPINGLTKWSHLFRQWRKSVFTKGSQFIRCEFRTLALTTNVPAITLPTAEVTNLDTIWLNAMNVNCFLVWKLVSRRRWLSKRLSEEASILNWTARLVCLRGKPDDRGILGIYLLWLNDRQPVKVFKLLTGRQSKGVEETHLIQTMTYRLRTAKRSRVTENMEV